MSSFKLTLPDFKLPKVEIEGVDLKQHVNKAKLSIFNLINKGANKLSKLTESN